MDAKLFRALFREFVESQRTERDKANAEAKLLAKIVKAGDDINRNLDKLQEITAIYGQATPHIDKAR